MTTITPLRRAAAVLLVGLVAGDAVAAARDPGTPPPAKGAARTTARRLEDIRIEGDVPVPQVIFVTARDPRRFMDFQHRLYLKTSLQLGRETVLPSRVHLVGVSPAIIHKESAP